MLCFWCIKQQLRPDKSVKGNSAVSFWPKIWTFETWFEILLSTHPFNGPIPYTMPLSHQLFVTCYNYPSFQFRSFSWFGRYIMSILSDIRRHVFGQKPHRLDISGSREHVHAACLHKLIPTAFKYLHVTRKACRLAGHINYRINAEIDNRADCFRMDSITRRIEYDSVSYTHLTLPTNREV